MMMRTQVCATSSKRALIVHAFPDVVQLMEQLDPDSDLGTTRRRDPDALPPSNRFETAMYWLHKAFAALGHGNAVFAIKAGLLTVVLSIPYRLRDSAHFAYSELPSQAALCVRT